MSYRIYGIKKDGKSKQLFGNNEYPATVLMELKKQGCKLDEDKCFENFKIKDFQAFLEATEAYIMMEYVFHKNRTYKPTNIFDLTLDEKQLENITLSLKELSDNAFIFASVNIINFFEDDIQLDYDEKRSKVIWKIKDGHEIMFSGF